MQARRLAGQTFSQCESCSGIWIPRGTILRLRGHGLETHPLLRHEPSPRDRSQRLACPQCGQAMHVYDYRGSKVTVDQCQPCDHIFLDAGELAVILRDWETGFTLSENSRTAMVDLHVKKAAATEGTEYVSLIVLSLTSVWVALQAVLEVSRTPIWLILAVVVPLLVSVIVWRIIQAQRRRSHAFHVAKIAELEPQLPATKPERTAKRIAAKPPVAPAPVIRGASAGYREPAPETRTKARNSPAGEPKWPEPGD